MSNTTSEPTLPQAANPLWKPAQVIIMSVVCLVIGIAVGYFLRGSAPAASAPSSARTAEATSGMPAGSNQQAMPSMEDLKRMADKKAEPLLAQLKTDPNNAETLNHLGILYKSAHQFKEAEDYFQKSLRVDPKNVNVMVDLSSCLYFSGDADGAIAELQKALAVDPKHAGALMNIGIMKFKAKNDVDGAIAAWEKLLALNPDFDQKELVLHMIEQAKHAKEGGGSMGITKG